MSSNDLETMSQGGHAISGYSTADVPDQAQVNSLPPVNLASNPKELGDIIAVIPNRETARSVQVSAAKRRKIIPEKSSTPALGLRTRNTTVKQPVNNPKKRKAVKRETLEGIKEATRSARKKRLQETIEVHDGKVRELFHLTKFVSLVDYNASAAKGDESEVFKEVVSIDPSRLIGSLKDPMTYGRKQQMQRQVEEFVQRDMLSALRKTSSAKLSQPRRQSPQRRL
jgi:hypothetical protein